MGVELFPRFEYPLVSVTTLLPGASAEEVERTVTRPLEDALGTVSALEGMHSESREGVSAVLVNFRLEKNRDVAVEEVRDKVGQALFVLPPGTTPPVVDKLDLGATPVLTFVVSSPRGEREVGELADKRVRPALEGLPGVGRVALAGARRRAISVEVDARELEAHGVAVDQVREALLAQNVDLPGGRVASPGRETVLRTLGRVREARDWDSVVVSSAGGRTVRVRDVGRALDSFEEPRTLARFDGAAAVELTVQKQADANTLEVASAVKARLRELEQALPRDVRLVVVHDPSAFIEGSIREVQKHLVLGAVLVGLTILLFLQRLADNAHRLRLDPGVDREHVHVPRRARLHDQQRDSPRARPRRRDRHRRRGRGAREHVLAGWRRRASRRARRRARRPRRSRSPSRRRRSRSSSSSCRSLSWRESSAASSRASGSPSRCRSSCRSESASRSPPCSARAFSGSAAERTTRETARERTSGIRARAGARRRSRGSTSARTSPPCASLSDTAGSSRSRRSSSSPPRPSFTSRSRRTFSPRTTRASSRSRSRARTAGRSSASRESWPSSSRGWPGSPPWCTSSRRWATSRAARQGRGRRHARDAPRLARAARAARPRSPGARPRAGPHARGRGRAAAHARRLRAGRHAPGPRRARRVPRPPGSVEVPPLTELAGAGTDLTFDLLGPDIDVLARLSEQILARTRRVPGVRDVDSTLALRKPELRVRVDRERATDLGVPLRSLAATLQTLVGGEVVTSWKDDRGRAVRRLAPRRAARRDRSARRRRAHGAVRHGGPRARLEPRDPRAARGPAQIDRIDRQRSVTVSATWTGSRSARRSRRSRRSRPTSTFRPATRSTSRATPRSSRRRRAAFLSRSSSRSSSCT